jgi:hypothetical protein
MERHHISGDRALAVLVHVSQDSQRKLRDVAAKLIKMTESTAPRQ